MAKNRRRLVKSEFLVSLKNGSVAHYPSEHGNAGVNPEIRHYDYESVNNVIAVLKTPYAKAKKQKSQKRASRVAHEYFRRVPVEYQKGHGYVNQLCVNLHAPWFNPNRGSEAKQKPDGCHGGVAAGQAVYPVHEIVNVYEPYPGEK
jgi:hypothetical protein